jgi:glycosyl transferase, family 25
LRVFYINLDHRIDRRAYMEAQFGTLGLQAERFRAATPADVTAADLAPVTAEEASRCLTPSEIATSVSHQRVWRRMIEDGNRHALVLEDDCELSPQFPTFLAEFDRQGGVGGLVRLETRSRRQILVRRATHAVLGVRLHQPYTWEWGLAAYIISADEARRVLGSPYRFRDPVDDMLLSPDSPMRVSSSLLQAVPALAFVPQQDIAEGSQPASVRQSDLQAERLRRFEEEKPKGRVRKLAREILRIQRQVADIRHILRDRVFRRTMVVPFARDPAI